MMRIDFEFINNSPSPEPIEATKGELLIKIGNTILTKCTYSWGNNEGDIHNKVIVSAYPLALWLTISWWRLLFESPPLKPDIYWKMSHVLPSANEGFIWPNIIFSPVEDEDVIKISAYPVYSNEGIQYINGLNSYSVSRHELETLFEGFIRKVISHIKTKGLNNTPLEYLWKEVQEARYDDLLGLFRKEEAKRKMNINR